MDKILCKCGSSFIESEFCNHFPHCRNFKGVFKKFDSTLGELLKEYSIDVGNLPIIKVLLKRYISVIESKLDSIITNKTCQKCKCKSLDIIFLQCNHYICRNCFKKCAESDLFNMYCSMCQKSISTDYAKKILGSKYQEIEDKFKPKDDENNIVECPRCHTPYLYEHGKKIDYGIKNEKNENISKEACEHFAQFRVKCINMTCNTTFCAKCKESPYHLGYTCEQYVKIKNAPKCKYDGAIITAINHGPANNVCSNQECVDRYSVSCKRILSCGHQCFGTVNDKCPPCLDSQCKTYKNVFDQDKDSYCNICFTEGLGSSPIVVLSCNHYIHYFCIKKRLETKWIGPKITFNHCLCPVCNNWYSCSNKTINALVNENKQLYKDICDKSLKRLKFENLDKDTKLTNPKSKWFGKKLEYALNRLSYYMCYKCKKPYFAGRRECGDGPNQDQNNPNKNYDPKDCVCGKCSNLSGVAGVTECKKHGNEFIEYKCKFCCKIASWFCWGNTHFCDDCHTRQCGGDYLTKYPKNKLPKCNPATCEVKMKHPPNGEEFALGCSICRNSAENAKDF